MFSGLIKSLRRADRDKTEHHSAKTEEDLAVLRKSEIMNANTAWCLVNEDISTIKNKVINLDLLCSL